MQDQVCMAAWLQTRTILSQNGVPSWSPVTIPVLIRVTISGHLLVHYHIYWRPLERRRLVTSHWL